MGFTIFFTAAPLAFMVSENKVNWLFQSAPGAAALFAVAATSLWVTYATVDSRSRSL